MKRTKTQSRRGAALESAIIFMVVVFTLCLLVTSVMLVTRQKNGISQATLERVTTVDEIGEDYLSALKSGTPFTVAYEDYDYTVVGNTLTVWKKTDTTKKTLLLVEAEYTEGELRVLSWQNTTAR